MIPHGSVRGRVPRLLLVGGLVALSVVAAGPARGQPGDGRPSGAAPKLVLAVAVDATLDDDKDKGLLGKAKASVKDLKADAKPAFPPTIPPVEKALDVAAGATLPALGLAESLLAGVARPAPPVKAELRWLQISGDRNLRALWLHPSDKADETTKKALEAAAKGREAREPFVHPNLNWVVFSRGKDDAPEYYALVTVPAGDTRLTEADLAVVRNVPLEVAGKPCIQMVFTDPEGKGKLAKLTAANEPKAGQPGRVLVLAVEDKSVQLFRVSATNTQGILELARGWAPDERQKAFDQLKGLAPNP